MLDGSTEPDTFGASLIHFPGRGDIFELTHGERHAGYLTPPETRELIEHLQLLLGLVDGAAR